MFITTVIIILILYRSYVFYKKRNDRRAHEESQAIYLHDFYPRHLTYFNSLNAAERQEFVERSIYIKKNLTYNSSPDLMVTENIKLLISASFTQITFGFDKFHLNNFDRIFLHPSVFYSRWVERDVKGLTIANGAIHWSWEDFVKGYMFSDDKLNLALHELAHALQIEYYENEDVETPEYEAWSALARAEINRMQMAPDKAYLRAYAATNLHEFFAVCVEYFFEDALQFRERLPDLYRATCKVMNQDMAARLDRTLIPGQAKDQFSFRGESQ
jgi:Mlc titration factor MtfA (ptsG expression regulator)